MFFKLALLGSNISYSLSPKIHNYWLNKYGIQGEYKILDIPPNDFNLATLRELIFQGFKGFNITLPYKELILNWAQKITPNVEIVKAGNCLALGEFNADYMKLGERNKINYVLDNTDVYGFIEGLKHQNNCLDYPISNALILGSGGAARAVVYALLNLSKAESRNSSSNFQVAAVSILARNNPKAHKLVADLRHLNPRVNLRVTKNLTQLRKINLVVNTTPVNPLSLLNLSYDKYVDKKCLFYDLRYNLKRNEFLDKATQGGYRATDGTIMLLAQAQASFYNWLGLKPNYLDQKLLELIT